MPYRINLLLDAARRLGIIVRMELPIIVLAAGQSSRMRGTDKLLEQVDGRPLLRRQVELARAASEAGVIVALPVAPHPRYDTLQGLDATCVAVPDASLGRMASLRRALRALPAGSPAVMVLLADLPDLTADDLAAVLRAVDLSTDVQIWRGVTGAGAPGHPVVIRDTLFPAIDPLTSDDDAKILMRAAKGRVAFCPLPGGHACADLDTPEDWAAWRSRNPGR